MDDRERRLQEALRAAVKAKNPWMAASIRAALRGEGYDPEGPNYSRIGGR